MVGRLATRQHGNVSRSQAYGFGASKTACDRRLASGLRLPTAHPGVYRLSTADVSWKQRLHAAVLAATDAPASHRSAAALHGIREGWPDELTVPARARGGISGVPFVHRSDVPSIDRTVLRFTWADVIERPDHVVGAVSRVWAA